MTLLIVAIIVVAWIVLSGFILISVCMMSSVSNRIELLTEDQLPHRKLQVEKGSSDEAPAQPTVQSPSW